MAGDLAFLVALFAVGLIGGFVIGRFTSGMRMALAWLLWLPSPLPVLAILLSINSDPNLPVERAPHAFEMGLALISIFAAIPWLPANLAGAVAGVVRRRRAKRRN